MPPRKRIQDQKLEDNDEPKKEELRENAEQVSSEKSGTEDSSSSSEQSSSDAQEKGEPKAEQSGKTKKSRKASRPPVKPVSEIGIAEAPTYPTLMSEDDFRDVGKSSFRRLFHWGPLIALGIIFYISIQAVWLHVMWWPVDTVGGFAHLTLFLVFVYQTITNHGTAAFVGGGYLPKKWIPDEEHHDHLQYCSICEGYKSPRAHHCSKCGRCVMKMDHHCPWINNCVGHRNHAYFIRFLASAIIGCTHAMFIIGISLYHSINLGWYMKYGDGSEPVVIITLYSFLSSIGAFTFAAGVTVALSVLLVIQVKYVKNNKNGIEEYIEQKALYRMRDDKYKTTLFTYPYDLGWKRNFKEVLCSWSGNTTGNGIWWPVRKDCTQYTLSEEQLRQKKLKEAYARVVEITQDYKGGCCNAITLGCGMFFCQPMSDEPRVKVEKGEKWVVTRGNKRWVYGYKQGANKSVKGWIPRKFTTLLTSKHAHKE